MEHWTIEGFRTTVAVYYNTDKVDGIEIWLKGRYKEREWVKWLSNTGKRKKKEWNKYHRHWERILAWLIHTRTKLWHFTHDQQSPTTALRLPVSRFTTSTSSYTLVFSYRKSLASHAPQATNSLCVTLSLCSIDKHLTLQRLADVTRGSITTPAKKKKKRKE